MAFYCNAGEHRSVAGAAMFGHYAKRVGCDAEVTHACGTVAVAESAVNALPSQNLRFSIGPSCISTSAAGKSRRAKHLGGTGRLDRHAQLAYIAKWKRKTYRRMLRLRDNVDFARDEDAKQMAMELVNKIMESLGQLETDRLTAATLEVDAESSSSF